jgi:hypothetical protein
MLSLCSWRFNHTSTDIGKLCLSTILLMLQSLNATTANNKSCSQVYRGTVYDMIIIRSFGKSSV